MSVLSRGQQLQVLSCLLEGNSERATERLSGVSRPAIARFAVACGTGAQRLHSRLARDLECANIEVDEIWSYVKKKQARVTEAEHAAGLGEAYSFTALAMPSRFVITWAVGKRDQATANAFITDLRSRLLVMPAITSDGFAPYITAIGRSFGGGIDYAQCVKQYTKGGRRDDDHRYEPPREPFVIKKAIFGAPDLDAATTTHVERQNGTNRHHNGRMRRLVLAFSKDPDHHKAAVALAYCWYNLGLIVKTIRMTPAMAAGVTDHIWEIGEFLDAILAESEVAAPEAKPLAHRTPAGVARRTSSGGWLRLVGAPSSASSGPAPAPMPPPPVAPVRVAAAGSPEVTAKPLEPTGQLDLLAWKPRAAPPPPAKPLPPKGSQLGLFGADLGALFGIDLEP